MRWIVALAALMLALLPMSIYAGGDVSVVAVPYTGGGLLSFTATYVNDTRVDLNWAFAPGTTIVRVVSKYGSAPVDENDGNIVYYGNATSFSDTSMNFDETTAILFYRAFGEIVPGLFGIGLNASVEGIIMTLLGLIVLAGILSYFALKNEFMLWKFVAAIGWVAVFMYIKDNPPGNLTEGEPAHVALMLVAITAGLAVAVLSIGRSISTTKPMGYGSGGGLNLSEWKWKFGKDKADMDRIDQTWNRMETSAEAYRNRVRKALRRE